MKVTDMEVRFGCVVTKADAHGNNVAWCCPSCGHPVLFVCMENQKGFNDSYTSCKGCKREYTINSDTDNTLKIKLKQ